MPFMIRAMITISIRLMTIVPRFCDNHKDMSYPPDQLSFSVSLVASVYFLMKSI